MKPANLLHTKEIEVIDIGTGPDSKLLRKRVDDLLADFYKPISRRWSTPVFRFMDLRQEWENETAHLSSITALSIHKAYQQIIGMGSVAIPFILRAMNEEPGYWFWALQAITGDDPVPPKDRGNIRKMTQAWLTWGHTQRYI